MAPITLRVYKEPGQAEVFCNLLMKDGAFERITAVIDTGAQTSLFPIDILDEVAHDFESRQVIHLEQAGISQQAFQGVQCVVTIFLEDIEGNQTRPMEIPAWFANTGIALLGFEGILDQSVLHIDMPTLTGYLDIKA